MAEYLTQDEIKKKIKKSLKHKKISQQKLASCMGYSDHSTISKQLSSNGYLTLETLIKASELTGISIEEIIYKGENE